ncbi:MAG: aldose 1-epimerase family protein [Planctomycetota bacterium]|jgi:hypothetical protein
MPKVFDQTLTSSERNINLDDFEARGSQITPRCKHPWFVRKHRLHGGKQEGVEILEIENGPMTMRLSPTCGMTIQEVVCGDVRLGWESPVKEVVHPAWINTLTRSATGWLEGFNGWLVRCGLEQFGAPGPDDHHLGKAEVPVTQLTLHGKVAYLPVSELSMTVDMKAPHTIRLRSEVNEVMMYGPKLRLTTELAIDPGATEFTVTDTVTNLGGQTQEFGLLYHTNLGAPILGDGARLVAPAKRVQPRDAESAKAGAKSYDVYGPPKKGSLEQAFFIDLFADTHHNTRMMLRNAGGDRGVAMGFSIEELPHFTLWKAQHDARDGYATGLEPGTNHPFDRATERAAGRVPKLKAGQSHQAKLRFSVLEDKAAVKEVAQKIEKLQRGRKTEFVEDAVAG